MKTSYLSRRKVFFSLSLTLALALAVVGLAYADQVVNDIDTTIDPALETRTITSGGSTTVGFFIQPSNTIPAGDANGCNSTGANPATVNLSVPAGVTASPSSLTFTGCGIVQNVTFSSSTPNSYTIAVASVTGGKSGNLWDTAPASFTLVVNPPADNIAPTASPTQSPAANAAGWNNTDVTVTWNWSDNAGGSGIDSANCTTSSTSSGEGTIVLSATCKDLAGNQGSATYTVKVDKTVPTASASASPAANANGWNNTNVTVFFSGSDGLSGITGCSDPVVLSSEGIGQSASGTCTDNAGNVSASATASGINIDKTTPTASASAAPAANANGWNNSPVTVSFSGSDIGGSGIDSCSASVTLSSEGTGQSASGTCTDLAGNESASASVTGINIDKTAPTFGACPVGGPFILNSGPQSVGPISVNAAISGLDAGLSTLSGSVDTSSIGSKSVTFTAVDNAGNSATKSCSYSVIYNWNGFFSPIDNGIVNSAKAGQAIPIKWRLTDANGTPISDPNSFTSVTAIPTLNGCGGVADTIETYAGSSGLQYLGDGYWQYNWKTPKSYAGMCLTMRLNLSDGVLNRTSEFKFK